MHFGRNTTWRRTSRVRPTLIATLIAIPLASGLAVGVIAANHSGTPSSQLNLSAQGFGFGHHFPRYATGSAAGTGVDLGQTPAEAADSTNCTLQVPANPLSAKGLASPYILGDGCEMSNPDLQAFVEADIINPRNGHIKVYNPLVITEGTQPAAAPVRPVLARGAVVAIMFGFNGDNLLLTGTGHSLRQGRCVNGAGQSLFTQVAYCNSPAFYRAANRDIARGAAQDPGPGHRQRRAGLPDRARLRRGGPGPERQRGHDLPDERAGTDRAGLRGQRGRPGRRHGDQQRQRQRAGQQVHGPGPGLHPV